MRSLQERNRSDCAVRSEGSNKEQSITVNRYPHIAMKSHLRSNSIEKAVIIARFQVARNDAAWIFLQIQRKHLLRDIVVVQFVVAQGNEYVQRCVVLVVEQNLLVNVNSFLVLVPIEENRGHAQLIFDVALPEHETH